MSLAPAVQHGAGVGESDEHVPGGRGPVQPVQLVPYVVRRHGGGSGLKDLRSKVRLKSEVAKR